MTIAAHRTYMAMQQKRKRPNLEPTSQLVNLREGPRKRICTSADTNPCMLLELVKQTSNSSETLIQELDHMELINQIVNDWTLHNNPEQERAFTIIVEHMLMKDLEQLLIFITGIGGSGKTHVIRAILDAFVRSGRYQQILLSAPTGSVACLIDGYTIHAVTLMNVGS